MLLTCRVACLAQFVLSAPFRGKKAPLLALSFTRSLRRGAKTTVMLTGAWPCRCNVTINTVLRIDANDLRQYLILHYLRTRIWNIRPCGQGITSRLCYQCVSIEPDLTCHWGTGGNEFHSSRPDKIQCLGRPWVQSTKPPKQAPSENVASSPRLARPPHADDSRPSPIDRNSCPQSACEICQPHEQQSVYAKCPWDGR